MNKVSVIFKTSDKNTRAAERELRREIIAVLEKYDCSSVKIETERRVMIWGKKQ